MLKKIILLFLMIAFFSSYYFVLANVEINEIMYNLKTGSDDGREWVEVYNNSDMEMDLSTFKFFEGDTNHKLTLVQGDVKLRAKGYALIVSDIAKFKTDWMNLFSGTIFVSIFDSTFSLNNSGESLAIKNGDVVVDEFSYKSNLGGAGDGKSLQKINQNTNTVWRGSVPTPGAENKIIFVPPPVPKEKSAISKMPVEQEKVKAKIEVLPITQNLYANVSSSDISDIKEENNNFFFVIILLFILSLSAGAVYFIRQKKTVSNTGDDFEILDE